MAYIIVIQNAEDEQVQIFAPDEFKMMAVLKKALAAEHYVVSVTAVENIIIAADYLEETDPNMNFGCQGDA